MVDIDITNEFGRLIRNSDSNLNGHWTNGVNSLGPGDAYIR